MKTLRVVSFKIEEDLLELLEEYARRKNLTKSEIIRRALEKYLREKPDMKPYVGKVMKIYA
ncbi:ribbon-helix-helix protein, CopG family [Aeropyrum pernix]|uniref:Ribbon-helix-helix protein, CopG family n=1 Tax=Aeropyrum pernix TaxID=56636 RepID=A0A401H8Y6_AERPX|nr:ribbon-helix-helix protein, CopG family [Aeropyrum pernix]